jgi:hypothetical protein
MKHIKLTTIFYLGIAALAQDVQFDYDRSKNFTVYQTYRWIDYKAVQISDQLLDRDIKRAVDAQLAGKGLRRVENGGDLLVDYQTSISQEKQFDSFGWGPGLLGAWSDRRITTSTIDVGKLVIGIFDPANKQLVWRGSAAKTLNISRDPGRNYHTLERGMAKLFRNYPPSQGKR